MFGVIELLSVSIDSVMFVDKLKSTAIVMLFCIVEFILEGMNDSS